MSKEVDQQTAMHERTCTAQKIRNKAQINSVCTVGSCCGSGSQVQVHEQETGIIAFFILQASNAYLRDQWLHSLKWKVCSCLLGEGRQCGSFYKAIMMVKFI